MVYHKPKFPDQPIPEGFKKCSREDECANPLGYILPATEEHFRKNTRTRSGLNSPCRVCESASSRKWQLEHPEQHRQSKRKWERAHPINVREMRHRNYAKNGVREREAHYRWKLNHPEQIRLLSRLDRSRRRALTRSSKFTKGDWQHALDYFHSQCAVCGRSEDFWTMIAADHWIPISRGGNGSKSNIIPLCHARKGVPNGTPCCNNSKYNKDPEAWLVERFGERKAKEILKRIQTYFNKQSE